MRGASSESAVDAVPKFINCQPGDRLAYPGYYRAVYSTRAQAFHADPTAQLRYVVNGRVDAVNALPFVVTPAPTIGPSATAAVLDVATMDDGAAHLLSDVVDALDPAVSWLPSWFSAVLLVSVERINEENATESSRQNATQRQQTDDAEQNPLGGLQTDLRLLLVVVLVVAIVYALGYVKTRKSATPTS